jgi:hypothetical protein
MSQHDFNIANQGFPAFRSDLNDALVALGTNSSGATAPATTFAHQFWMDTAADPSILKVRNADNDAWITLGTFNQTTDTFTPAGVTSDKIEEGNSKVEVVDTGTGYIVFEVDGAEVARFNPDQLVTKAGTASTPAISPTGDLNTGIFFPAADTIAFAEGGAEAMRINSSGNVLVGGTSFAGGNDKNVVINHTDAGVSGGFALNGSTTSLQAYNFNRAGAYEGRIFYSQTSQFMTFDVNAAERMRIDSSGNINIATTNDSAARLVINGADNHVINTIRNGTGVSTHIAFRNGNGQVGTISTSNSTTSYNTSSDYRLKENIAPMTGALATVQQLKPCTYTWRVDGSAGQGFIAHELQEVIPDCVTGEKDATEIRQVEVSPAIPATFDDDGNELTPAIEAVYEEREVPKYQGVDTSFLVATLTAAIQELSAKNDALEARIAALEQA